MGMGDRRVLEAQGSGKVKTLDMVVVFQYLMTHGWWVWPRGHDDGKQLSCQSRNYSPH